MSQTEPIEATPAEATPADVVRTKAAASGVTPAPMTGVFAPATDFPRHPLLAAAPPAPAGVRRAPRAGPTGRRAHSRAA